MSEGGLSGNVVVWLRGKRVFAIMKVLLLEDDDATRSHIAKALGAAGHVVDLCTTGQDAIFMGSSNSYAVLILDRMVPGINGLGVVKVLRAAGITTPALFLTAMDGVEDRVEGLEAGADDYLVKPFDLDELAARIRSTLRRSTGQVEPERHLGDIHIQPATRSVRRGDQPVALSAREYAIVDALITRLGAILSRAQLEERLYGWSDEIESNAVEVHIHGIRRKLGADFIRNVRGVGYYIAKPEQAP
jgi:two-component system response regulator QseB